MAHRKNTTLMIDRNDRDLDDIYEKYKRVVYYDDSEEYSSRVLTGLKQIEDDYILFIHDNDILLETKDDVVEELYAMARENRWDRVDLKHTPCPNFGGDIVFRDGLRLVLQTDPNNYIYNVNPSIWKRESFVELFTNHPNRSYRDVEGHDVQNFCLLRYRVWKMDGPHNLRHGYYNSHPFFRYLHITHGGRFLRMNLENMTPYGQSYVDVVEEYQEIVDKYKLKESTKWAS
jgi:hypothetical protein